MQLQIAPNFGFPLEVVTETIAILAKRRSGKALALDTPLPTPKGWTTMGEVQVGDLLFDEAGKPCRVTYATPVQEDRRCYRVTFSDGNQIVADADHLWLSENLASRRADGQRKFYPHRALGRVGRPQCQRSAFPVLVTTEQMAATLRVPIGASGRQDLNHSVRCAKTIRTRRQTLPIDPYVLGAWLGDGTSQSSYFTTADEEMLDNIRLRGYSLGPARAFSPSGKSASYRIGSAKENVPLHRQLRELELLNNKHIPALYLRASAAQRLELLAGLMDTDGTVATGSNGCIFYNKKEGLADAVEELVGSLGWVARRGTKVAKLNGKEHGICHMVTFRPTQQVFKLSRKADLLCFDVGQESRALRRMVADIEPVESVPVRCIQVDSPNHLYLVGKGFIPTHNTYAAAVLVEEMIKAGLPVVVVVVDPIGVWWGLRSGADGKSPGLPVVIFGGDRADLPLGENMGAAIADVVVEQRFPAVLDLSLLDKGASRRFMTAFAERLFVRNSEALHLVLDEADAWAPQRAMDGGQRLLGAIEDLVRRGRSRGLGMTLITQRPAILHKDVLALRMTGPRDVAAIDEWVRLHADEDVARKLKSSLPALPVGTAWVWSPGWLSVLKQIKIRRRETFDSSATPKVGEKRVEPSARATVDLEALRERLHEQVEAELASDPRALQKQIADLKRQLKAGGGRFERVEVPVEVRVEVPVEVVVEVPILAEGEVERLEARAHDMLELAKDLGNLGGEILSKLNGLNAPRQPIVEATPVKAKASAPKPSPRLALPARPKSPKPSKSSAVVEEALSRPRQRILDALAAFAALGVDDVARANVAVWAGSSPRSGGFTNNLGGLRTLGLIHYPNPKRVALTDEGRALAQAPAEPSTLAQLHEAWHARLSVPRARILRVLIEIYPESVSRVELAELTEQSASSGGYTNNLGALRSLGVLDYPQPGHVVATDLLFPAGLK